MSHSMKPSFSIPFALFDAYTKDAIHEKLKNNKRFACEIVAAVYLIGLVAAEKAGGVALVEPGVGFNKYDQKFAGDLAKQILSKGVAVAGGEPKGKDGGMSWGQTKYIFKFAHKYASQAQELLNSEMVKVIEVQRPPVVMYRRG